MSGDCDQVSTGSAQPVEVHEKRRCEHIAPSGHHCGRWASHGEELCHAHLRYAEARARERVDVPLLEDEMSILYVLSQTTHALATGAMPPVNGHAVISACKLATRVLELRLKQRQWEAKQDPIKTEDPEEEYPVSDDDPDMMAVSDEACDQPFVPAGQRACDRVQARVDAAKAARYAQEGPRIELPRFCKVDLKKQWESGIERPYLRNRINMGPNREETGAMLKWQIAHPEIMRAREQRMLDEYYGRVKKEEQPKETQDA